MAASALSPKIQQPIGQYLPFVTGVVAMSSGTATVDLSSKFYVVEGAVGAICDAATGVGQTVTFSFSGASVVIETISEGGTLTGSSLVSYLVWGKPKA